MSYNAIIPFERICTLSSIDFSESGFDGMVTRNDVARLAGVSPAVVSYVINNSNYVSQKKRSAVLKAIEELGYYPNALARSLKSGISNQILLISDDIRSEMFSEITFYMEHIANESGYSLTISSYTQENALYTLNSLNGRQYAGAFIFSALIPLDSRYIQTLNRLADDGIPTVLFKFAKTEHDLNSKITQIRPNIREAVCNAVDYLFDEKKHKIVAYLGDGNPEETHEQGYGDGFRVNGYQDSLRKHNIDPQRKYIFFLDAFKYENRRYLNVEGTMHAYFSMKPEERPTAFYVNSDTMAAELVKSFQHHGISVPQEIEIIGFGNTRSASLITPELTTIEVPCKDIGESAIRLLLNKISGIETEDKYFKLNLIKRESA